MAVNIIISCKQCGKSIKRDYRERKYCSMDCRLLGMKARPRHCLNCGCFFSPVKPQKVTGKYISFNAGKTCSLKCAHEWISNNEERKKKISAAFSGSNHPNWQGGKSLVNNIGNRGPHWQRQRKAALKRDKCRCVDCGCTEDESLTRFKRGLDVDHVIPFHNFSNYRKANALGNLASRCQSCHRKAEAKRGMGQMVLPLSESRRGHHSYSRERQITNATLTKLDVINIRRLSNEGQSIKNIHGDYPQVGWYAVYCVVKGKTWKHVC